MELLNTSQLGFSDGTTQDISSLVNWTSSNSSNVVIDPSTGIGTGEIQQEQLQLLQHYYLLPHFQLYQTEDLLLLQLN